MSGFVLKKVVNNLKSCMVKPRLRGMSEINMKHNWAKCERQAFCLDRDPEKSATKQDDCPNS